MSPLVKYAIAGGAAWLLSLFIFGAGLISTLILLGVIAAPIVAWFMLDPSQRKRLMRIRKKQIGG